MPLGKWFDNILSAGQKPIVVRWTETNPDHAVSQGAVYMKRICHDDIFLTVCAPKFGEEETRLSFSVFNMSGKTLGFGILGVGLVVIAKGQKTSQPCKGLILGFISEDIRKNVMIETGQKAHIDAIFDRQPAGEFTEILIQANRIGVAPYLFNIAFGLGTQSPAVPKEKIVRYFFEGQAPSGEWVRTADRELFKTEAEADAGGRDFFKNKWPHRVVRLELDELPWYEK